KMDAADVAYIDLHNVAAKRVDVGDLRISALGAIPAGRFVASSDPDLNDPLVNIKGTLRQVQDANVVYKAGSGYYINADVGTVGDFLTVSGSSGAASASQLADLQAQVAALQQQVGGAHPATAKGLALVHGSPGMTSTTVLLGLVGLAVVLRRRAA